MNKIADAADQPLVLVADDDATHRRVLQGILEKAGFRVVLAENGKIALEQFSERQPDVVLLDVEMPELDGFSVCETIRAQEGLRETPIFIITGREDKEAVARAYSVGATDFLNKPIAHRKSGKIALEQFSETEPDVVLLDVEMPELDGFSVCETIRAQEGLRETPIFIITGREDKEAVARAYSVGATDFLNKPIALPVLPHRIHYVLRTSTSLNDLRGLIRAIPDLIFAVDRACICCV